MSEIPFLINEDEALKGLLRGMIVSDDNADRKVGVWFRYPDPEERQVTFPFVTIEMADISEEVDRAHRGFFKPTYQYEGYEAPVDGFGQLGELPVPVSLIYRVTSYARSAWHDRQIQAQLIGNRLPLRFGSLYVPADDTVRRLDFLDFGQFDGYDENNKRVFRKTYTVRVSSELLPDRIVAIQKVTHVVPTFFYQLETFDVDVTT